MPDGPKPPIPPSYGRIAISGAYSGTEWTNIFHVEGSEDGTPTQADWATVVQDVLNAYQTNLMPKQMTASVCQLARGVYIPSEGTELVAEKTSTTAGGTSGTGLPANVAACISWTISAYYRGGKPRTYLPAISNNDTATVNSLTTTYAASLQSAAAAFLAAVNAITTPTIQPVTLVNLAFARHNEWLEPPVAYPVLGAAVHLRLDSQRRRLGKEAS